MASFKFDNLTPMQLGRLHAALDKRYNFNTAGVMTLRAFIESRPDGRKHTGNRMHEWDRRRFNRMSGAEQVAYEKRLARPDYQFRWGEGYSISIPKIVFDAMAD